jgi:hypothetical protein
MFRADLYCTNVKLSFFMIRTTISGAQPKAGQQRIWGTNWQQIKTLQ